ncbi:MAG: DNA-binding protein WhiA [Mycoplasma sp.]
MSAELTFSEIVKNEVCHLEYNAECAKMILTSFFINSSEFIMNGSEKYYVVYSYYNYIVRLIKSLLKIIDPNIKCEVLQSNITNPKLKRKYVVMIKQYERIDELFNNLQIPSKLNSDAKRSFVLGAFLSSGSIYFSKINSNYHFELRSSNISYLKKIKSIFKTFAIESNIIEYRSKYKLYIKKAVYIGDILKLLGTTESLYQFEDFRIMKDHYNSEQRIINLDVSNINKTIVASNKQLIWIQTIINKYAMGELDQKSQIFCEVRRKYPEKSLSNLAEVIEDEYSITIPRTSLNHIVRRIENLYLKIKDK